MIASASRVTYRDGQSRGPIWGMATFSRMGQLRRRWVRRGGGMRSARARPSTPYRASGTAEVVARARRSTARTYVGFSCARSARC